MTQDGQKFLGDFAEALMLAKVDALDMPDEFGGDHFRNVIRVRTLPTYQSSKTRLLAPVDGFFNHGMLA